jgi:hypothetical protein
MQSITFKIITNIIAMSVLCCVYGCDKESNTDALRRKYPIPTELPEVTCDGANTVGARFDSILFVANYFPNTSSWGSPTPEDGVRAFFRYPSGGLEPFIEVFAEHPIRPNEIDNRRMNSFLWYYPNLDSLAHLSFRYVGGGGGGLQL